MQLIIIAGQAGVGKTTLANLVAEEVFELGFIPKLMSFAGALKEMAEKKGIAKADNPSEYRKFCQEYGAIKRKQDESYWVKKFQKDVNKLLIEEQKDLKNEKKFWERCIIVDDCRYMNELEFGLKNNATIIFLSFGLRENPNQDAEWTTHHSEDLANAIEAGEEKFSDAFTCFLKNQGTIQDLKEKIAGFVPIWCGLHPDDDERMTKLSKCVNDLIDLLLLDHLDEEEDDEDAEGAD